MATKEDITERKRAQEALEQAANRFKLVTLATQDAIFDWDFVAHEVWKNENYQRLFGTPENSPDGNNWWVDHLHPEDRERVVAAQNAALSSGDKPFLAEYRLRRADGSYADVVERSLIVRDAKGHVVRMIGALTDVTEHRRADEALRRSDQRYKDFISHGKEGFWRVEVDPPLPLELPEEERTERFLRCSYIAECNLALAHSFGLSAPEEALGKCLGDLCSPSDTERIESYRSAARGGFQNRTVEFRSLDSAGNRKDLLRTEVPIIENGSLVRIWGITRDITELRRAEEALALSEQRYRELFENANDIVFSYDLQGNLTSVNKAGERRSGYTHEELRSMNLFQLVPPEYVEKVRSVVADLAAGRDPGTTEWEVVAKEGHRLWLEASSRVLRAKAERPEVQVIGRDITERKRAEEALRESEARFRAVFEDAAIGIALVNMHGHPVESNPALQKMLGYNKTELAQMVFTELAHPADVETDRGLFMELVEGKRDQYQLERRLHRKDDEVVWGQLTFSLVRNQDGAPLYAIGMVEDITARKQAVEALRQLSGRLLHIQDEERRRIARELHDSTAQSLAALAMNLSAGKEAAPDLTPKASACIQKSLDLAEQCLREIRTLSYLLHPPLLDEAGLASALRWFVDGFTQRTGIHVDLEMPHELIRLPGDIELALYRVVQEGLTNIHLHSGSKKAHISLGYRPDQAVLTVADNGRGLPSGLLQRGGQRGAKLGVGIPGMRERIRQLGGQFEIITGSNGTTLTATVPFRKEQA